MNRQLKQSYANFVDKDFVLIGTREERLVFI